MILLENKPNVVAPGGAYPYGNIRDNDGTGNGTPLNQLVHADFHQFFSKMFAESGIVANGLPDNATNTFQLFQALIDNMHKAVSLHVVNALLGNNYTTNDVVVLYGCVITATIPGSSSITSGAIYYNGKIYSVAANGAIVTTGTQTLVFKINSTVNPNVIYLTNDESGTGIADYNAASVKKYPYLIPKTQIDPSLFGSGWIASGFGGLYYRVRYDGLKEIFGYARLDTYDVGTGGTLFNNTDPIPAALIPNANQEGDPVQQMYGQAKNISTTTNYFVFIQGNSLGFSPISAAENGTSFRLYVQYY